MPAPKQWHKAFVTLPPEWRVLTYFQRSLMQDYWRLSDADCSGRIEVAGDPVKFLVRLLDLDSKGDRSAAVRETQKLINLGLLVHTQVDGSVGHVAVRTAVLRPRSSDVPASFGTQPTTSVSNDAVTTRPNATESLIGAVQIERENRVEREIERPGESSADWTVGLRWFADALFGGDTTQAPNVGKWRDDYAFIGRQSEVDRAAAARTAQADAWVQANRRATNPGHFVKHWGKYTSGGPKAVAKAPSGVEQAEADRKASAASKLVQLRKEFAAQIKAARDQGDEYEVAKLSAERDMRLARLEAQAS